MITLPTVCGFGQRSQRLGTFTTAATRAFETAMAPTGECTDLLMIGLVEA